MDHEQWWKRSDLVAARARVLMAGPSLLRVELTDSKRPLTLRAPPGSWPEGTLIEVLTEVEGAEAPRVLAVRGIEPGSPSVAVAEPLFVGPSGSKERLRAQANADLRNWWQGIRGFFSGLTRRAESDDDLVVSGRVEYDWKWRNDTEDPVADLARIAGAKDLFRLIAIDEDGWGLRFESRVGKARSEHHVGEIHGLPAEMNRVLERTGAPLRIGSVETGGDRLCFVAVTPDQLAKLEEDEE